MRIETTALPCVPPLAMSSSVRMTPCIQHNGHPARCNVCGDTRTPSRSFTVPCVAINAPFTADVCNTCIARARNTTCPARCLVCNALTMPVHTFHVHCKPTASVFIIDVCAACILAATK